MLRRSIGLFVIAGIILFSSILEAQAGLAYRFTLQGRVRSVKDVTIGGMGMIQGANSHMMLTLPAEQGGRSQRIVVIVRDSGKLRAVVIPSLRGYIDVTTMRHELDSLGISMDAFNVKMTAKYKGEGPKILGLSTKHFHIIQKMDVMASVQGQQVKAHHESSIDMYLASELSEFRNPFFLLGHATGSDVYSGSEYVAAMASLDSSLAGEGFPLKVRSKTTISGYGQRRSTNSVFEVTGFRDDSTPNPSIFEVPSRYQRISVLNMMAVANSSDLSGMNRDRQQPPHDMVGRSFGGLIISRNSSDTAFMREREEWLYANGKHEEYVKILPLIDSLTRDFYARSSRSGIVPQIPQAQLKFVAQNFAARYTAKDISRFADLDTSFGWNLTTPHENPLNFYSHQSDVVVIAKARDINTSAPGSDGLRGSVVLEVIEVLKGDSTLKQIDVRLISGISVNGDTIVFPGEIVTRSTESSRKIVSYPPDQEFLAFLACSTYSFRILAYNGTPLTDRKYCVPVGRTMIPADSEKQESVKSKTGLMQTVYTQEQLQHFKSYLRDTAAAAKLR